MSTLTSAGTSKLTAADRKLFQGTAAAVHPWQSNAEILASIGCNFNVIRTPAERSGRSYPDCQLWLRDDNQDLLGFFGTKRQIIQPATFIDFFRGFCDASEKAISLDVVGSYNKGRSLYMAAKLNGNNSALLDSSIGGGYRSGGGMAISRAGHSAYIPSEDRTDHWLMLSESFGEALRPRVSVIASELICSNSLARRITECEIKLSHSQSMNPDVVHAVLDHAIRQCSAYDRIKERLITTPISMDTARSALRRFFADQDGNSRIVQRLDQIYAHDLIGSELATRRGNAWRLASAVTQYTSHERIRNGDVAFRSQLEGSRARTANGFLHFLEEQLIDRTSLLQG
jgi:hypothetical protein